MLALTKNKRNPSLKQDKYLGKAEGNTLGKTKQQTKAQALKQDRVWDCFRR